MCIGLYPRNYVLYIRKSRKRYSSDKDDERERYDDNMMIYVTTNTTIDQNMDHEHTLSKYH